jgi:hypoxanthine-guanine phosphoribosyltransferase
MGRGTEGVGRLWSCVLLDKPSRREVDDRVDFVGFTTDDVFVAGSALIMARNLGNCRTSSWSIRV